MTKLGSPFSKNATKMLLLGSGELGKELAIEAQKFGIEVIAVDRYEGAPAMQVAHRSYSIDMLDAVALKKIILKEKPTYIVPEVEAIATNSLLALEEDGFTVIPSAKAVHLTMNRKKIRTLANKTLGLPTSPYFFADTKEQYVQATQKMPLPFIVKPLMSSSGKGQSMVKNKEDIGAAWKSSQVKGRTGKEGVIIEGVIDFDYEITLLTVRHVNGISFCEPIGHRQENGDYRESWQPHPMNESVRKKSENIARTIVDSLGGYGIFGVELFIQGETVYFSEVSPRPHDTGMVTMISQNFSEFALHVRAILGLPIPSIRFLGPSASSAIVRTGENQNISYHELNKALAEKDTDMRLFGKPEINGYRRLGVALARSNTIDDALKKAKRVNDLVKVH